MSDFIKSEIYDLALRKDEILKASLIKVDNKGKPWKFFINLPEGNYIEFYLKNTEEPIYIKYSSYEDAQKVIEGL